MAEIGEQIAYHRREKRMTREDLAQRIGIDWLSLFRLERGYDHPERWHLARIERELSLPPGTLDKKYEAK